MEEQNSNAALVHDPDPDQIELELGIPKTLRTEFNFLKFPFFDLARDSSRPKIKIEEEVETKDGTLRMLWQVTRDIESQFPGDFEKRLYRAIEQIINVTPKPVENPLPVGSLRHIAKLMGINPDSGKNREDIQRAFRNIVKASIEANGTYQVKESKAKRYIKDTFHLYDRVIFKGEELPDGQPADSVYLMLGSWYINNVNNHYVVPLDWHFYNRLSGTITTRMYEYLCIHFFATLEYGRKHHDMRYSQICDYFPLTKQYPLWKAKKQLKHAHESLVAAGYFAEVQWLKTNKRNDWIVRYMIGPRAQAEYERNKNEVKHIGIGRPVLIPPQRRKQKQLKQQTEQPVEEPETAKELNKRGISRRIALRLSWGYPEEYLQHKIEVFDWLFETGSHSVKENPAGFLRMSIEEDYAEPAKFVSKEERELRRKKAEALKKREEWLIKIEDYRSELQITPEQKIYGEQILWERDYKREHNRTPTTEEKTIKRAELIANLPTPQQRQEQIFGKILFSAETPEELEIELRQGGGQAV